MLNKKTTLPKRVNLVSNSNFFLQIADLHSRRETVTNANLDLDRTSHPKLAITFAVIELEHVILHVLSSIKYNCILVLPGV